jgi:hypothetical protein
MQNFSQPPPTLNNLPTNQPTINTAHKKAAEQFSCSAAFPLWKDIGFAGEPFLFYNPTD